MDTSGKNSYRENELEDAMDLFDEGTKSKAVMQAVDFSKRMHANLEEALEHEDMTPELAEVLSTSQFNLTYEINIERGINRE